MLIMDSARTKLSWECIGLSLTGASHTGRNLPRQDSIGCWPEGPKVSTNYVLSVADGHGSALHSRSKIGSRIAVELGTKHLRKMLKDHADESLSEPSGISISEAICADWKKRTLQYADCEPLPLTVTESLSTEHRARLSSSPEVAYGSTLLCAAVGGGAAHFFRIGDGTICFVSECGDVAFPFEEQEKKSQHTDSLCSENAAEKMSYVTLSFSNEIPPAFILLATDGYSDAVGGIAPYKKRVQIFWRMLKEQGIEKFATAIGDHLESAKSDLFDDTTLGFLIRPDWLKPKGK